MKIKGKKISLATQIFAAMIAGGILGLTVGKPMVSLGFIGDIWLNCVKMIIVPMILVTILTGIVSQKDIKTLGRISVRIMAYYILTTLVACCVGLIVTSIIRPGTFADFTGLASQEVSGEANITVSEFFTSLFSDNMVQTFADGNIIQTLIVAVMLGIAVLQMKSGEYRKKAISALNVLNDWIFSLIGLVMKASPIGVFFLMGSSFGKYGASIFTGIASLLGTYYFACLVHVFLVYGGVLFFTCRINPLRFIKDSAELWMCTISTCSSVASIPINIKVAREKFGVPEKISSFTVPLGSQMNYDGSVILYGCVILFISQSIGLTLTIGTLVKVVLLSAILSTGGGGIPGSGIVKLMVMVEAFGLPTEIVGIIAAFYRLFDMGTTTNNCVGDLAGTIFVSKWEERSRRRE